MSDRFILQPQPLKVLASDGLNGLRLARDDANGGDGLAKQPMVNEGDEFDGWDSSWYWDSDFDCLSAAEDSSSIEIVSVATVSSEEDKPEDSVVDVDDDILPKDEESICAEDPPTDSAGNCDLLSNEDYLKKFEEKFHQSKEDFRFSLSSVSSSLSSSDSSPLELIRSVVSPRVTPDEGEGHGFVLFEPSSSSLSSMPSLSASVRTRSFVALKTFEPVSSAVHRLEPIRQQIDAEVIRNDEASSSSPSLKSNRKRKKLPHRTTAPIARVATSEETGRVQLVGCQTVVSNSRLVRSPASTVVPGFGPDQFSGCRMIVVSGLSAVVGVFCGLLIGGLFANNKENFPINDDQPSCEKCLGSSEQNVQRLILSSIWAQKYEELVLENADLHTRLQHLDSQLALDFLHLRHSVAGIKKEFGKLNSDFSELEKDTDGRKDRVLPLDPVRFFPTPSSRSCADAAESDNQSKYCYKSLGGRSL